MSAWRVGTKLGRTLYRDGVCVGMVDTPEIAKEIVAALETNPRRWCCKVCGSSWDVHTSSMKDACRAGAFQAGFTEITEWRP